MIRIEFTCFVCGEKSEISPDDIEEKEVVPVCETCYKLFKVDKERAVELFIKKIKSVYGKYDIPVGTFNAGEEIVID